MSNAINNDSISPCPPGCQIPGGVKHEYHPQHQHVHHQSIEAVYMSRKMQISDTVPVSPVAPEQATPARKASNPMKKVKQEWEDVTESMLIKSQE